MTTEGVSSYEWVNVRYNGCFWHLMFGNWFNFTQFVIDQRLNRVNISYISTSSKILSWCLHNTEPSKNEWIRSNEEYDFKLWCLLSAFHHSAPRHTTTGEPSEHWDAPGDGQEAHRPLCWDTCLFPLARTRHLIKWKSISMLLTPCCFSSWFKAVMYWQLRVVSIHSFLHKKP